MIAKLLHIWHEIRTSFWFIPGLMVLAAIALAQTFISIDQGLGPESFGVLPFVFNAGPEGARSVLSTIAASMISIAGLTFSITIVVLTLASSQFGPRLLRNFMKDTRNQIVLGTFISTFIYCLLVLRTVQSLEGEYIVPQISVTFSILLALANSGILIYFIHHIARSIQADNLIAAVYAELIENIQRLFPQEIGEKFEAAGVSEPQTKTDNLESRGSIHSAKAGYLQAIDPEGLMEIAREEDVLLNLHQRPGDFIEDGCQIVSVLGNKAPDDAISSRIRDCFIIGKQRTPEQDAEFAVLQLVEIAGRALSPGINDPFTAMTCVNHLGSAICCLSGKVFPEAERYDGDNKLRVVARPITFAGITNAAFDQIRQYGRSNVTVTIKLLEALTAIASQARNPEQVRALRRQADMIHQGSRDSLPEKQDRLDIEESYQTFLKTLADNPKLTKKKPTQIYQGGNIMDRKAFIEKLDAQLKEWDAQISELEAKVEKAEGETKQKYWDQIAKLKQKKQNAENKLNEIKQAGEEAWEELKDGTERVFAEMKDVVQSVISKFE